MISFAVIGTFFGRLENTKPLLWQVLVASTRKPDEAWFLGETEADVAEIRRARKACGRIETRVRVVHRPTPRREGGTYAEIPYSSKINYALDRVKSDLVVYLDNGSMPHPEKYKWMVEALEARPEWGAVYCGQRRTGLHETVAAADSVVSDGYCALNYTQVMHRVTADRWPLDMKLANPDLADGHFWRLLHKRLGDFHPAGSVFVLDEHHIPGASAAGVG